MAKKYTLHYLSDKEFDRLPYKLATTAWGAADEKTGNAYVRRTGLRPVDEFIAEHELAELIAKVSPDEIDGIRYKAGENFFSNLGAALTGQPQSGDKGMSPTAAQYSNTAVANSPIVSSPNVPTTSSQEAKSNPVTGSLGASTPTTNTSTINQPSTGGLNQAFENYQSNQLGFASTPVSLGGQTSYVSPNLSTINTNQPAAQNSFSSPNSIANMFSTNQATNKNLGSDVSLGNQNYNVTGGSNGLTAAPTSTAKTLGFENPAIATPTSETKANVPLQSINQAPATPGIQTGGEVSSVSKGETKSSTPFMDNIFGKDWRQTLLGQGLKAGVGAGLAAIGQATAKKADVVNPTDSALYNQVVERVQSGTQIELTPAQKTAITQNYDTQLDNARKNIIERFKALRPGSDIANDSQLQSALIELENNFAEQKAAAITAAQLGLTQQQTAQLSQLAAADINYLSQVAGVSNQEAADFKAMMASLGAMVATGGQQRVYS